MLPFILRTGCAFVSFSMSTVASNPFRRDIRAATLAAWIACARSLKVVRSRPFQRKSHSAPCGKITKRSWSITAILMAVSGINQERAC